MSYLLNRLRQEMRKKQLDYYLVGSSDPHNSEDVPEHWRYLAKVSGFSGSLGYLLVGAQDFAGLWVDSRYHIQAERECPKEIQIFRVGQPGVPQLQQYWQQKLSEAKQPLRFGFDQRCFSHQSLGRLLASKCPLDGSSLNIDQVWPPQDAAPPESPSGQSGQNEQAQYARPKRPQTPVYSYAIEYCGQSRSDKVGQVRKVLQAMALDYYPITTLDNIAWLLNIRAADIDYNPVAISYVLLGHKALCWYIEKERISAELWAELQTDLPELEIKDYELFYQDYEQLRQTQATFLLTAQHNLSLLGNGTKAGAQAWNQKLGRDIITDLKAIRNPTEQEQLRRIMALDGAALTGFHNWLRPLDSGSQEAAQSAKKDKLNEYLLGQHLEQFRKDIGAKGESFAPIVAFGANSALPHYSAPAEGSQEIQRQGGWLLIDSGGQYFGGTTDMTRCFPLQFGNAPQELCHIYTLVLKGHLQLQNVRFPKGTLGVQLDILARQFLWAEQKNYQHGTGHGVGNFLNVHEDPISISTAPLNEALKPGMLVSNEPGFYREGSFGMRIENLLLVQEIRQEEPRAQSEQSWLCFEPVSTFPYERELLDKNILSQQEIQWIDHYHAHCLERILSSQKLNPEQQAWLQKRCAPID